MLERDEERKRQASQLNLPDAFTEEDNEETPVPRHARLSSMGNQSESTEQPTPIIKHDSLAQNAEGEVINDEDDDHNASSALRRYLSDGEDLERADEGTPLLARPKMAAKGLGAALGDWKRRASKITGRDVVQGAIVEPITLLPATILGLLLNVLDGVSYGMIL
jgi:SulP family sulfate permease